jgi:trk system potassium uptake protein TrkA
MKAIIVGAGEVGVNIAQHLAHEGQDVVIIDLDEAKLRHINETLDIQTIVGSGSYPDVLAKAGCDHADMLVAVTDSDEINMVACQMGYSLFDVPMKIARVENRSYLSVTHNRIYTPENMPVDMIISPEMEVADTMLRNMTVPSAFDTYLFGDDQILLVGLNVGDDASILNVPFRKMQNKLNIPFRAVAIFRGGRLIVPHSSDHLEQGDELYFICESSKVEESVARLGVEMKPIRNVFVIGGGGIGYDLCRRLEQLNISTRVLEYNKERAQFLAENLQKTTVLYGDALDHDLLLQENIGEMDVVLAVTSNDSTNILASISAGQLGAKSVTTMINGADFLRLSDRLKLETVVSPRYITASRIVHFTRRGHVMSLHTLHEGEAEVSEVKISNESPLVGMSMADLKLPDGILVPAIYSEDRGIILSGDDKIIHAGDRAVIFSTAEQIQAVAKLV